MGNELKNPEMGVRLACRDYAARLSKIRHVAFDMDGTIYKGSFLFPFTNPSLGKLKNLGVEYSFLTNNPSKSLEDYLKKLSGMGVEASKENLYTSALAAIDWLKKNRPEIKRVFFLGTRSMISEFDSAGFESCSDSAEDEPDAVVVGFDMELVYSRLCRAAWWVKSGKPYFATNPDRVCPTNLPTVLVDCASICASIECATGRAPDLVFGKPDPSMLTGIMLRKNISNAEMAMVGDRLYTDMATAKNAGALSVLVLTGEASEEDALSCGCKPDLILDDIRVLADLLEKYRKV